MDVRSALQSVYENRSTALEVPDVAGMRALFAYIDTNRDGTLSAKQALCIFQLLGLSAHEEHVYELEQMSFPEFISIVDHHTKIATADPTLHSWNTINHFRNDYVSRDQLACFLVNCDGKQVPPAHLDRFLELYGISNELDPHLGELEETGYLKLLDDYKDDDAVEKGNRRRHAVKNLSVPPPLQVTSLEPAQGDSVDAGNAV
ncbi:unnamed protein product [Aphanomyces euteiches]